LEALGEIGGFDAEMRSKLPLSEMGVPSRVEELEVAEPRAPINAAPRGDRFEFVIGRTELRDNEIGFASELSLVLEWIFGVELEVGSSGFA
jgi:hypothetical protein